MKIKNVTPPSKRTTRLKPIKAKLRSQLKPKGLSWPAAVSATPAFHFLQPKPLNAG